MTTVGYPQRAAGACEHRRLTFSRYLQYGRLVEWVSCRCGMKILCKED